MILVDPKNIAVTRETRYKLAFLKTSEEHLYDTVGRLVEDEVERQSDLEIPPMPDDY